MFTFELWWKGECVDTAETAKEARYLQREYAMAFHSAVTVKKVKRDAAEEQFYVDAHNLLNGEESK